MRASATSFSSHKKARGLDGDRHGGSPVPPPPLPARVKVHTNFGPFTSGPAFRKIPIPAVPEWPAGVTIIALRHRNHPVSADRNLRIGREPTIIFRKNGRHARL